MKIIAECKKMSKQSSLTIGDSFRSFKIIDSWEIPILVSAEFQLNFAFSRKRKKNYNDWSSWIAHKKKKEKNKRMNSPVIRNTQTHRHALICLILQMIKNVGLQQPCFGLPDIIAVLRIGIFYIRICMHVHTYISAFFSHFFHFLFLRSFPLSFVNCLLGM